VVGNGLKPLKSNPPFAVGGEAVARASAGPRVTNTAAKTASTEKTNLRMSPSSDAHV
jgi:hypothetical protein